MYRGICFGGIAALSITVQAAETSSENAKLAKRIAVIPFQPLTAEEESGNTVCLSDLRHRYFQR